MNKKEHSTIKMAPKWGYGKTGNKEYGIEADATLEFDIALGDFEKQKQNWEMNTEEKLAEADKVKLRGNEFIKTGKILNWPIRNTNGSKICFSTKKDLKANMRNNETNC